MVKVSVARIMIVLFVLISGLLTSVWAAPRVTPQARIDLSPFGVPDQRVTGPKEVIDANGKVAGEGVELVLDTVPSSQAARNATIEPLVMNAEEQLALDDGTAEENVGVVQGDGGPSVQFLWLNRFSLAPAQFPFRLDRVELFFDGSADGAKAGDDIDLVVYHDPDGNPANGATWLATFSEQVQIADGSSWSAYELSPSVTVPSAGDILIGVVNRFVQSGVTPATYPAALDDNLSQRRSWIGWWQEADPPSPTALPPNDVFSLVDDLGASGNWMIRGFGETTAPASFEIFIPQVTSNVPLGDEYDPNDHWLEAYGPLVSGQIYHALPNDAEDYYYFELSSPAEVTVNVTNFAPTSSFGTVLLYGPAAGQELGDLVDYFGLSGFSAMSLGPHTLDVGKYYVRINTVEGHYSNTQLYSLQVSYNAAGCPPGRLIPNDPGYGQQWGLEMINASRAWFCGFRGDSDAVVAVIDSGVDLDHPEFAGRLVPGWDWANNDGTPDDDNGHGTHVAGIVGAIGNNGTGVAGVGWETSIMPLKTLDARGSGYISWSAAAVIWAADHGADVVNMSLGSTYNSRSLQDAITYAHNKGVLVVASAGNCGDANYWLNGCDREDEPSYPGANNNVVAVAATTKADLQSSFSTQGSYVDIAAPGSSIYSGYKDGGYATMSGTSQAAPHVAGLAALVKAAQASHSPDQIADIIQKSALDLGSPGRDSQYGWGRIDVAAALGTDAPLAAFLDDAAVQSAPTTPVLRDSGADIGSGTVLVKFKPKVLPQGAADVLATLDVRAQVTASVPQIDVLVLEVPVGSEWDVIDALRESPRVEYAEPDLVLWAH